MGEMIKLDDTGDSKFMWDSDNDAEIKAAKKQFETLKKEGYVPYSVKKDGSRGAKLVGDFDPDLEKLIMVPGLVGG